MSSRRTISSHTRQKVLVAMSGGVDSSVAACLLHEQGYDVVGVFMRLGGEPANESALSTNEDGDSTSIRLPLAGPDRTSSPDRHRGCCSAADATDARIVAGRLGIPFYALNFEQEFSRLIDYFADEYAAARTPNPCVRCNQWLKFGRLIDYADAIDADLIATGHYARIDHTGRHPRLLRARSTEKDQSYVLFGVPPGVLPRTLFPLGNLTKQEVRAHARRFGLAVHDKAESQDLCFVQNRDYARVVRARRPHAAAPGEIRHIDGRLLGRHDGLINYTIGQRRGLGIAVGSPVYVSRLDAGSATVTVGPEASVYSTTAQASRVQWLCDTPIEPIRADVRIRYNHEAAPAEVFLLDDDRVKVVFDEPQWAVTPGQAMVFYAGDEVLGGGWIE